MELRTSTLPTEQFPQPVFETRSYYVVKAGQTRLVWLSCLSILKAGLIGNTQWCAELFAGHSQICVLQPPLCVILSYLLCSEKSLCFPVTPLCALQYCPLSRQEAFRITKYCYLSWVIIALIFSVQCPRWCCFMYFLGYYSIPGYQAASDLCGS